MSLGAEPIALPDELCRAGDMGMIGHVLDSLGVAACVIDADEQILSWNDAFRVFFPEHDGLLRVGWPYAENLRNFVAHNLREGGREDAATAAAVERHRNMRGPSTFQKQDGRWLRSQIVWFADGSCLKYWSDITKTLDADLDAARLVEMLGTFDSAILVYDAEGRFRVANRRASELLPHIIFQEGASYAEHLRQVGETALDPAEAPRVGQLIERFSAMRQPITSPMILRRRPEGWFRLEERATRAGGLNVVLTDITTLKRMEDANDVLTQQAQELRHLTEALARARDEAVAERGRAEEANRAKSMFLAVMSHELRTPLNAILGFSEIVRDELHGPLGKPQYLDHVKAIHAAGSHLLALVNDVLDLSRIEAGARALQIELFDLLPLARTTMRLVSETMRAGDITVDLDIEQGGLPLHADARAVRQMLLNLLSNAAKFTPRAGRVRIGARRLSDSSTHVSVSDTGHGMTAEQARVAMEPFRQLDHPLGRTQSGVGLGLPIVRSLMGLHGGRMEIESSPGRGTTVSLYFPAAPVG